MTNFDLERTERLLSMIEEQIMDSKITQNATLEVLKEMRANQKKELENIRFNTGWGLYILIAILISVSTGWFWE